MEYSNKKNDLNDYDEIVIDIRKVIAIAWSRKYWILSILVLMIILASGKPEKSLKIVAVSVLLSIAAFLSAGFLGAESFLPAGIIAYNAGLAILGLIYVKKRWGFPVKQLFRAIPDTLHFIRKYTGKAGK